VADHPVTGLTDDEVPRFARRQWRALDHSSAGKSHVTHAARDAVHGAEPGELADQAAADGGEAQLAFRGDISITERVSREIAFEVRARKVPQDLRNALLVTAGAAQAREEPAERGGVERDLGAVVVGVSDLGRNAEQALDRGDDFRVEIGFMAAEGEFEA